MREALKALVDELYAADRQSASRQLHAVVGPAYSGEAEPIALLAPLFNLLVVSPTADSSALSDTGRYPLFARTCQTSANYHYGEVELLRHFGWHDVSAVYYDEPSARDVYYHI